MLSFVWLCVLLGLGHLLRMKIKLLRTLYLPSCVIGGLLGLAVLQILHTAGGGESGFWVSIDAAARQWSAPWGKLPGFLINIVFACLFLGVKLPPISTLWKRSGPQVCYGQTVAWGQYVVGLGLFLILIKPLFPSLPDMFGGTLPVGFEGGHGTAAGLGPVFAEKGWAAGTDFALTSATFGILSAITVGIILVNWAARKGYTHKSGEDISKVLEDDTVGVIPLDQRPSAGRLTVKSDAIESLSLHLVIVGLAVGLGYLLKQGLVGLESQVTYLARHSLLSSFPLFPLCMLAGLLIQYLEERFDNHNLIDLGLIRRIQNSALDFLVIAAIATINLRVVVSGLLPLTILVAAGIVWNVFCVIYLARRMLPDAWFERAIAEMGQSMGVTATGLLLLRVVDPDYESPAADAFACKQLIHEPFMGGGLWTGAAIPLIAAHGAGPIFLFSTAVLAVWLGVVFVPKIMKKAPKS